MTQIEKAKAFASQAHAGQKYGGKPYTYHLEKVVGVAERFCLPEDIKVACWLHDTVEDTDVAFEDIQWQFGTLIATLVWSVTDEGTDFVRWAKLSLCPDGLILKLCDRIANVEECIENGKTKWIEDYKRDMVKFNEIASRQDYGSAQSLTRHLDGLFKRIYDY